jgi:hypothetical protein
MVKALFLYDTVKHIGELAAVVILFVQDKITSKEFLKGGLAAFTV